MKRTTIALLVVAGLLFGASAGVWFALPHAVERVALWAADHVGESFARDITWENLQYTPSGRLQFEGVRVQERGRTEGPAMVALDRVDVRFVPESIFTGKLRLEGVTLHGAHAHLVRREDGSDNYQDFIERLNRLLTGGGEGGGESTSPLRFLARVLPSLEVTGASLTFEDLRPQGGLFGIRTVHLDQGHVSAVDKSFVQERLQFEFTGSVRVRELQNTLLFKGKAAWPEKTHEFSMVMAEKLVYPLGQREVTVGGLGWSVDGDLTLTDVAISAPGARASSTDAKPEVSIGKVMLTLRDEPDAGASEGPGPSGRVESLIRRALARVRRVTLVEPQLVVARYSDRTTSLSDLTGDFMGRIPIPADEEPPERARPRSQRNSAGKVDGSRVRQALVEVFTGLQEGVEGVADLAHRGGMLLPTDEISIDHGAVIYGDELLFERGFQTRLSNFNMRVRRNPEANVVSWEMDFETGNQRRSLNHLKGRVQLDTRDMQVSMGAQAFELGPYRSLFPESMPPHKDTIVHDTNLNLVYSHENRDVRMEGRFAIRGLTVHAPRIAPEPMTDISLAINGALSMSIGESRLVLEDGAFRLGKVTAGIHGTVDSFDEAPRMALQMTLDETPCQALVDSLPSALIPRLKGLQVVGSFGWDVSGSLDTADMSSLRYEMKPTLDDFRVLRLGKHVSFELVRGQFLQTVVEPDETVKEFVTGPGAPGWVDYDRISPWMKSVVTATEDGRFFRHEGFSPFAIKESIITNLQKGGFHRGASTISQQLVKNLFLTREKTVSRKVQEFFITWQMERVFTKPELMALYFNVIEFGPGIYGIVDASEHYFGKHPSDLTLLDSLFLCSLIPNPKKYYYQFQRGSVTDNWEKRLEFFARSMVNRNKLTQAEYDKTRPFRPHFKGSPMNGHQVELAPDEELLDNQLMFDEDLLIPAHELDDSELESDDHLAFDPEVAP